jgi:hypothetical protein
VDRRREFLDVVERLSQGVVAVAVTEKVVAGADSDDPEDPAPTRAR